MLTFLATTEARARQTAALRAVRQEGRLGQSEARSWRGNENDFGFTAVARSFGSFVSFVNMFSYSNIITCRHTNKSSSALVVPAPRVSTVLNT